MYTLKSLQRPSKGVLSGLAGLHGQAATATPAMPLQPSRRRYRSLQHAAAKLLLQVLQQHFISMGFQPSSQWHLIRRFLLQEA